MKKVFALILCLSMMLGFASCAKKVEVPSKSDVKKAAADEFDMDFKVDSEDISDDEKEAEWVLISKDGSLQVTVTWNAKDPDKFEFDDEELAAPTESETAPTTSEDPTTESSEDPTTTTTEATTADSSEDNGGSTAAPSGVKYVNFDEMNFYINGKKVDEYGGTMGIATIEDMLEELVGNITDEFDDEADEFVKLSNGDYIVRGDMTLSDLEDVLDIELDNDEYDTIAGLVISQLDRVPEETEHPVVNYKNLRIKVLKVEENAIAKVLIHINPIEAPEEAGKEENSKSDE